MLIPRGIRNNNPGNIIKSGIDWLGEKESLDESHFEVFDTPEHGIRALAVLLVSYQYKHGCDTIRKIINRWAPPVENNTSAYVDAVAARMMRGADVPLDTRDAGTLRLLTNAIIWHENGQNPYTAAQIAGAVSAALGLPADPPIAGDRSPPQLRQRKGTPMGESLIAGLVTALIQGFQPKAEQLAGDLLAKNGADSKTGQALIATIANAVLPGVMNLPPQQQVDAFAAAAKDPVIMAKAETSAVDYINAVSPLLDKANAFEAGARADTRGDLNDSVVRKNPALLSQRTLAWMIFGAMVLVGLCMILAMGMLAYQAFMAKDGKVDAFVASLATMAFMAITSMAQAPFRSVFGQLFESQAATTTRDTVRDTTPQRGQS